jgi:hypothetical protein
MVQRQDPGGQRKEFANVMLDPRTTFEFKRFGILGVGVKRDGGKDLEVAEPDPQASEIKDRLSFREKRPYFSPANSAKR